MRLAAHFKIFFQLRNLNLGMELSSLTDEIDLKKMVELNASLTSALESYKKRAATILFAEASIKYAR